MIVKTPVVIRILLYTLITAFVVLQPQPRVLQSLARSGEGNWSLDTTLDNHKVEEGGLRDSSSEVGEDHISDNEDDVNSSSTATGTLEFVHITKSGGTAMEKAAYTQAKLCWGARHYMDGDNCEIRRPAVNETALTPSRNITAPVESEPWHLPTHWWHPDPFQNVSTFTVVRNPYSRVLSEYYCRFFGPTTYANQKADPAYMNRWIQETIEKNKKRRQVGHMMPSHYFVYDDNGNRRITHILGYEQLHDDFRRLMEMYNLSAIRLEPKPELPSVTKQKYPRLSERDFSKESIEVINEYFAHDFDRFGYDQIEGPEEFEAYDFSAKALPSWR